MTYIVHTATTTMTFASLYKADEARHQFNLSGVFSWID